ncbi:hypothetical protein [Sphingobium yanoikuyae]|uniref:hypothetical protein n=1 Tax=Sphingobium yanoikuyae TaxID=13690 RepID=UPI0022DE85FB|nr:hypothetical protein [Sphingobium yanoikuyae]WBQ17482.1 hypothetical protein PAE53_04555 [Sphingobium yanoikuyae]
MAAAPIPAATAQEPQPTPAQAGGKIVMFRVGSIMGAGVGCPLRYKGQEVVELGRNKFAEWPVPAGSYILTNKTASVEVNVMPGQTKYVRCTIKPGFMSGRADLQIVDAETFAQHQDEYERKEVAAIAVAAN